MKIKILTVICLLSQLTSAFDSKPVPPLSSGAGAAYGSDFKPKATVLNNAPHKEMTLSEHLAMQNRTKQLRAQAVIAKSRLEEKKLDRAVEILKSKLATKEQDLETAKEALEQAKSVNTWKPAQAFCVGILAGACLLLGHRAATDPEFGRAAKVPLRSFFSKR
jgi:hypothetical protein